MFSDLKSKIVVITGGHGFLGKQFASAFLNVGCKVIIIDTKEKKSKFDTYQCDITNEKDVNLLFKKIISKYKKIDVLINNAANNPQIDSRISNKLENYSIKEWNKDIDVSLTGTLICTKIFGTKMSKQSSGGSIINISSDLGLIAPDHRIYKPSNFIKPVSYSAVKHAIIGLTKYTASYWASKNVRCNAIAPGGMFNNQNKNFLSNIKKLIPLKRLAKKNEFNSLILYLASKESSYVTGTTISIDGGRTII